MKGKFNIVVDSIPEDIDAEIVSVKVVDKKGKKLTIEYEIEPQIVKGLEVYERTMYEIIPGNENYNWYIEFLRIKKKKIYCNLCVSVRKSDGIISFIDLKPACWGGLNEVSKISPCSEREINAINYIRVNYPEQGAGDFEIKWSDVKFKEILEKANSDSNKEEGV